MIKVHHPRCGLARRFFGTSAREKRSMEHGHLHFPGVIRNGNREEAGILVVHVNEIDALKFSKGREPQSLPVKQILRYCQGDPWATGRKCRVSHYVALQRFDKRDAGILAAATAVEVPLIIGFRFQCDAEPLNACRIAGFIEPYSGNADARVIPPRNQAREQVKFTVRATSGGRVQDAFDLLRIPRLRLHQHCQTPQLESARQCLRDSHHAA